jgi:hypothetical protein
MLSVEVTLYAKDRGGRQYPIEDLGYACFCKINPRDRTAYECRINFYCKYPVSPGETRRADIFLITGEDAESIFGKSGRFFLCEDRIIGEACTHAHRLSADLGRGNMSLSKAARRRARELWASSGAADEIFKTRKQRNLTG